MGFGCRIGRSYSAAENLSQTNTALCQGTIFKIKLSTVHAIGKTEIDKCDYVA